MQVRIVKECRALAPMWGVALLAALAPALFGSLETPVWFPCLAVGALLLCVSSFGKEFAHGTYSLLLSQPASRWRLWREKTLPLAGMLTSVLVVSWLATLFGTAMTPDLTPGLSFLIGLLIAGAAYGGGLCLTLLLRQANGAFWLALFFPTALCIFIEWLVHRISADADAGPWLVGAMIVYIGGTYALGLWLFLRREDIAWGSTEVTLPLALPRLARRAPSASDRRGSNAMRATLNKEFRLQQVNLLGGMLLVFLFLGVAAGRQSPTEIGGISLFEIVRGMYWLVWGLMPFLVGATAIAEERRLGVLEWQQTLPVARTRQFLAKSVFACGLSVALAIVLPWVLEAAGEAATGESLTGLLGIVRESWSAAHVATALGLTLGLPVLAVIGATLVGLFASSLARNLLQALSLIVGLIFASWTFAALYLSPYLNLDRSPGGLLALIGLPIAISVLARLAYRNYCEAIPGARLWLRNLGVIGATYALAFGLTSTLYARAWELFIPEPQFSSARINGPATPRITFHHVPFFVLLPSGTLWEWRPAPPKLQPPLPGHLEQVGPPGIWRDVASRTLRGNSYTNETVALRADGTLWHWYYFSTTRTPITDPGFRRQTEPVPFGTDHDWRSIAGGGAHFLALKTNGSLWAWGLNGAGQLGDGTTVDRDEPVRVGSDTNWARVALGAGISLGVKTDGSLWEWGGVAPEGNRVAVGSANHSMCLSPRRVGQGTNWLSAEVDVSNAHLALQTDGSLWSWGWPGRSASIDGIPIVQGPTRVGRTRGWTHMNWLGGQAIGLKEDGTLWTSGRLALGPDWGRGEPFVRRSKQKPWLATAVFGYDFGVALAADGSLWVWGDEEREDGSHLRLIPPSQRLRRIAGLAEATGR